MIPSLGDTEGRNTSGPAPWSMTAEFNDHIQYRPRGGVHRYQYGKNFWKFDFGRGQRFEARDRYGEKYSQPWNKLNFSSLVQQVKPSTTAANKDC